MLLALACLGSSGLAQSDQGPPISRVRPQPRQIFRDGVVEESSPYLSRRPLPQDFRRRQEQLSLGQLPLGPRPEYDNAEFKPEDAKELHASDAMQFDDSDDEALYDLGAFSSPNVPSPSSVVDESRDDEQHSDEEGSLQLSEYNVNEEQYIPEDHIEPTINFIEGKEEDYYTEIRSPSHRYPDEEHTASDEETSATTMADQHVTPSSIEVNELNRFTRFDDDPPVEQGSNEQLHGSSGKFERSSIPNQYSSRAQDRNFETRATPPR